MSHGRRIDLPINIELPRASKERGSSHLQQQEHPHRHDSEKPNLKHNAAQMLNHEWDNLQAHGRKNNLLAILTGTKHDSPHGEKHRSDSQTLLPQAKSLVENYVSKTERFIGRTEHHPDRTSSYVNKTLDNLINLAREHKDFEKFQKHTETFWRDVSRMSEVKVLDFLNGDKHETRVVSRYAELLDKFNRHGGRIETFLRSLPVHEREVFAARHQLEQTFGASKFFVGNGVTLNENGDFGLRQFLTNNGKAVDLPLHFVAVLRENGLLDAENRILPNNQFFPAGRQALTSNQNGQVLFNGQILFNAESAALVGISLAFYQNLDALVNLKNVLFYPAFQNFMNAATAEEIPALPLPLNFLAGEAKTSLLTAAMKSDALLTQKTDEPKIVGALVNGALLTSDKNQKTRDKFAVEAANNGDASGRLGFSAGATGAMLGAAIGCLVPLAETIAGTALGLATSIVIGTPERGLRSLSVNMLISDAVTRGVQTLLNAAPKDLSADSVKTFAPLEDLKSNLFNRRLNAYLTA